MKGAIAWFAENHVAANLLMLFLLIAGVTTGLSIKLEVFPETTLDRITISTVYPGASPSEVEEGIITRIEEKIAGLPGIKEIDSLAREGAGTVTVEIMTGWDGKKLLDEIKSEVDRITTFPEEAEKPIVKEMTRRRQVINLAVYGDAPEASLKHMAEKIRDDITNLPGVTQAELSAVRNSEIHIEIAEKTLRRYGLTLGQVAEAVTRGSLDLPAGSVKTDEGEILIRTKGRRYYAADYGDIPVITRSNGSRVTLEQIADLKEGFADVDLFARFKGKPAVMINVYRVADQSALSITRVVKAYLKEIKPEIPAGIFVDTYADMSKILKSRIELLMKNLAVGLGLVVFLLWFFINLRLSFWVTLGIPISFAAGIALLPHVDVSINMISLFAFIMVLGIVVDDAIIVGENIYSRQEIGESALQAAIGGTIEVGRPVIFSVLTTMVAFWPLLLAGGTMGKFMRNIPIVVILVLAGSLIESLFILPAHLARIKAVHLTRKREKLSSQALKWIINKPYRRLVAFCIRWRYVTVAAGIAALLLTFGIWKAGLIKFVFFPKVEGDTLECLITMPVGTPTKQTREVITRLEQTALDMLAEVDRKRPDDAPPLLEHHMSLIGAHLGRHGRQGERGGHLGQIWIQLLDGERRDISSMKLNRMWRQRIGNVPNAESIAFRSELHSAGNAIEVNLSMDDHLSLLMAVKELKTEIKKYPGVFDIEDSFLPGKKEIQIKLNPQAQSLGITLNDLARQVRHAFYGAEALRFQRGEDEIKVLVRYPETERNSLGYVETMHIMTPAGVRVPFSQVAQVKEERGYASIKHAQRRQVVKVMADVDEKVNNASEIRNDLMSHYLPQLKSRYPGLRYTIEGAGKRQRESLADVNRGFILALFGIYALLAIPFRSFSQPLIVMAAIPFGLVGAVCGHLLMGFDISFISLFGMVGLSGVVVNDSLVLIYRTNRFRGELGKNAIDAVIQAGISRFRAIILTSLTTFAGLTPILLERSIQAQFLIPMAVSLGFGVLFATVITLVLIPCGYVIHDDIHRLLKWLGIGSETKAHSTKGL